MDPHQGDLLRHRLRQALTSALKNRDTVAVAALRSSLGAIDNAEAVDASLAPSSGPSALGVSGLGAGEVPRLQLDKARLEEIVRLEIDERLSASDEYEALGRAIESQRLRAEADVLQAQLGHDEAPSAAETS